MVVAAAAVASLVAAAAAVVVAVVVATACPLPTKHKHKILITWNVRAHLENILRGQLGSDTESLRKTERERDREGVGGTGRCPVAAAAAGRLSVVQRYLPPNILCNYESFWRSALNINAARCQRYGKNVIINSSSSSSYVAKPQLNPNYAGGRVGVAGVL